MGIKNLRNQQIDYFVSGRPAGRHDAYIYQNGCLRERLEAHNFFPEVGWDSIINREIVSVNVLTPIYVID